MCLRSKPATTWPASVVIFMPCIYRDIYWKTKGPMPCNFSMTTSPIAKRQISAATHGWGLPICCQTPGFGLKIFPLMVRVFSEQRQIVHFIIWTKTLRFRGHWESEARRPTNHELLPPSSGPSIQSHMIIHGGVAPLHRLILQPKTNLSSSRLNTLTYKTSKQSKLDVWLASWSCYNYPGCSLPKVC